MGWLVVSKWDRRDSANREEFGAAALRLCQAAKSGGATASSRFYWATPDRIAIVNEADDLSAYWAPPGPDLGAAMFAMADLAVLSSTEQWADAGTGETTYRESGR